ncbi:hypothetical protein ACF1BE_25785 [Streptomyces sp. NPDC014991]|uniref:hypothetical protein n=1 Tax=Streptomyces sp. NPDC014991 TaxID=3364935 RepID=UPI0036F4F202
MVTERGHQLARRRPRRVRPAAGAGGPLVPEARQPGERATEQRAGHGDDAGPHRDIILGRVDLFGLTAATG